MTETASTYLYNGLDVCTPPCREPAMTVAELTVGMRVRVNAGKYQGMTGVVVSVTDGRVLVRMTSWGTVGWFWLERLVPA